MSEKQIETPYIWLNEYESSGKAACGCTLSRCHDGEGGPAVCLCRLHKAAPDLLEAAKATLDRLTAWADSARIYEKQTGRVEHHYEAQNYDALAVALSAAIAKAEGRQP